MSIYSGLEMYMYDFRKAVKELSDSVNNAQFEWGDKKYSELRAGIGRVAADSRAVMQASESLMAAISRFERIN